MSEEELKAEWQYRYEERLGILTDGAQRSLNPATNEQRRIARAEADAWLADWRKAQELL